MTDEDRRISELYRGLPRDEPPAALDAAIVGAARRAVASRLRAWYVPVSIAAVVVLSVAVTLRIQQEQPDLETVATAPPAKAVAPLPEAKLAAPTQAPAAPAAAPSEPRMVARPGADQRSAVVGVETRKPAAKTPDAQPASRPAPAFVPDPESRKRDALAAASRDDRQAAGRLAETAPASRASAEVASEADTASAPRASVGAALAPRDALTRERQERPAPAAAPAPARAKQELAKQSAANVESPERWLERIAELRRLGREKEADDSLAEFRKRYPEYRIPQEMLNRIQPR